MIESGSRLEAVQSVTLPAVRGQLPPVVVLMTGQAFPGQRLVANDSRLTWSRAELADMATRTVGSGMFSQQGIVRVPIVNEGQGFPAKPPCRMAALTSLCELGSMSVHMAAGASSGTRCIAYEPGLRQGRRGILAGVTRRTCQIPVLAGEGIAKSVMSEAGGTKILRRVTVAAILPELSLVSVVVVAVAALLELESREATCSVAFFAGHFLVPALQGIARARVIKGIGSRPHLPVGQRMATPAVLPQIGLVDISMTIRATGKGESDPNLVAVAVLALRALVRSQKRKARTGMIELDRFEFPIQGVAALAILSQLSPVNVLMAGRAGGIGDQVGVGESSRERGLRVMAILTLGDLLVQSQERNPCAGVLETLTVPVDHVEVDALMVAMALGAAPLRQPVKSSLLFETSGNFGVTVQTFPAVDSFSRSVAAEALIEPRQGLVRAAQITRRNQALESLSRHERHADPPIHDQNQDPPHQFNP